MSGLRHLYCFALALVIFAVPMLPAIAQDTQKTRISLVADRVSFDPGKQVLTAAGNVQIFQGDQVLTTELIIYDQKSKKIDIPSQLIITTGDGVTTRATSALLDGDLENGLVRGAEILIAQQIQLVSSEFHRIDGRYKVLSKTVGSSCHVCAANPVPWWQIRAKRVIHDEKEKRLYFENARVEALGVPIFYVPHLRVPDPTVDRATGFLVPRYSSSNTLGYGLEVPYYWTLGDHADYTLTPKFYSKGSFLVNNVYRREFASGSIFLDGSFTLADELTTRTVRSSLSANGEFFLDNKFELNFGVELASDDTVRSDYSFGTDNQERLISFVSLNRTDRNSYIGVSSSYIQSLRANEVDQEIPLVFPQIYARKTYAMPYIGGTFGLTAQSLVLLRESNSQFYRAGINFDWERSWTSNFGLITTAYGELANSVYYTNNYNNTTQSSYTEVIPTAAIDFRLPFSKQVGAVTHSIEPRIQLVWSDSSARTNPNEDSVQVEFEDTNLFSYNRFPGFDKTERGLRANIGLTYRRYDPDGWDVAFTLGQILRDKDYGQFSSGTGLDGDKSDFVSAISVDFQDKFSFFNRASFDNNFNLSKNEAQLAFLYRNLIGAATYVWLEADVVANASDRRHEGTISASYRQSDFWSYSAGWTHNFATQQPTRGNFGVTYENECVAVNLSLSLQYEGSGIVRPTREVGLTVELAGLGNKKRNKKYAHRCATL